MGCDIFSLIGITNIADWLAQWQDSYYQAYSQTKKNHPDEIGKYQIRMSTEYMCRFVGYTVQQYITKTIRDQKRATVAYEAILKEIPERIEQSLGRFVAKPLVTNDMRLGDVPHMYSLVPLAQKAHTPIHGLTGKDGLSGGQYSQQARVQRLHRRPLQVAARKPSSGTRCRTMIEWPGDLVEDIAARRCVLFLGSGVSKNSKNKKGERPKDWKEYLTLMADQVSEKAKREEILTCISEGDFLTACELARKFLKPDVFKRKLLAEYSDKAFEPSSIHDRLSALDSRLVLTTNFDKLYENRANQIQQSTVLVKNYYDSDVADVLRRSQRAVIKVHGTIDSPENTIFTRSDYAVARIRYAHFYQILDALFLTYTFIFLGASMRDPDIQLLLENQAYRFAGSRPHYIVMPRDSTRQTFLEVIEESMNLRALLYDPKDGHTELDESLASLVPLVAAQREELTRTTAW